MVAGKPVREKSSSQIPTGKITINTVKTIEKPKVEETQSPLDIDLGSNFGGSAMGQRISAKVVKVFDSVGKFLAKYKSGKLPKPFKIMATLINWEEILDITCPEKWSPAAVYEGTKIFSSAAPNIAEIFYQEVLLPAVRRDIGHNKGKLNFHLFEALKKAVFKPKAWVRGILLPLAQENCTMREAAVLSSLLSKISLPIMHGAVAILKLAEIRPWYNTTSVLLGSLINKKYALPRQVIVALVEHFAQFTRRTDEVMPVVWHQALLSLVQRYKGSLVADKVLIRKLLDVMKVHQHKDITAEIRREVSAATQELRLIEKGAIMRD